MAGRWRRAERKKRDKSVQTFPYQTIQQFHSRPVPPRERARANLLAFLSTEQRDTFLKREYFDVCIQTWYRPHALSITYRAHVRRYRLTREWSGGVYLMGDSDQAVARFCINSFFSGNQHIDDCLLAQKLLLEADERMFLWIANPYDFRN